MSLIIFYKDINGNAHILSDTNRFDNKGRIIDSKVKKFKYYENWKSVIACIGNSELCQNLLSSHMDSKDEKIKFFRYIDNTLTVWDGNERVTIDLSNYESFLYVAGIGADIVRGYISSWEIRGCIKEIELMWSDLFNQVHKVYSKVSKTYEHLTI